MPTLLRQSIHLTLQLSLYLTLSACSTSDNQSSPVPTAPKAWGTATLIETENAGRAIFPQIAVDATGHALAVWTQSDGTQFNIWANRYTVGTGWGTAQLLETDNTGDALAPQIAVDATGQALAVWEQHDGTRDSIWANRYQ